MESLRLTFNDISEKDRRLLLCENAAELYNFDLEKLRPLANQYGPTPSQVDQPLAREEIPVDATGVIFRNALFNQPSEG